jgi:hypothetical protein
MKGEIFKYMPILLPILLGGLIGIGGTIIGTYYTNKHSKKLYKATEKRELMNKLIQAIIEFQTEYSDLTQLIRNIHTGYKVVYSLEAKILGYGLNQIEKQILSDRMTKSIDESFSNQAIYSIRCSKVMNRIFLFLFYFPKDSELVSIGKEFANLTNKERDNLAIADHYYKDLKNHNSMEFQDKAIQEYNEIQIRATKRMKELFDSLKG